MTQGSEEWHAARLGKVTASRVADVVAKTKAGYGSSRASYMAELIVERLTGRRANSFTNDAMRWGIETEAEARAAYCFRTDYDVAECGFVQHHRIEMAGASPDGLVEGLGLLEIKCPNSLTHIDTLLSKKLPEKYIAQIQWQLACCSGLGWCDFVSYDPRLPEAMRILIIRVTRDDVAVARLEKEVTAFLVELDAMQCALRSAYDLGTCLEDSV